MEREMVKEKEREKAQIWCEADRLACHKQQQQVQQQKQKIQQQQQQQQQYERSQILQL